MDLMGNGAAITRGERWRLVSEGERRRRKLPSLRDRDINRRGERQGSPRYAQSDLVNVVLGIGQLDGELFRFCFGFGDGHGNLERHRGFSIWKASR